VIGFASVAFHPLAFVGIDLPAVLAAR